MLRKFEWRRRTVRRMPWLPETLEIRLNLSASTGLVSATPQLDFEVEDADESSAGYFFESDAEYLLYAEDHKEDYSSDSRLEFDDLDGDQNDESDDAAERWFVAESEDHDEAGEQETPEFEALEQILELAHETQVVVSVGDHHVNLLDDVISHVASDLLVSESTLRELVVVPSGQSSVLVTNQATSDNPVAAGLLADEREGTDTESADDEPESAVILTSIAGSDKAAIDGPETIASSQQQELVTPPWGTESDGRQQADVELEENTEQSGVATFEDRGAGGTAESQLPSHGEMAGALIAGERADAATIPVPRLGIRFGDEFELFEGGVQLFVPGEATRRSDVNVVAHFASHGTDGGTPAVIFGTALLSGGLWAIRSSERRAAVQLIARRVSRNFPV
jgi:hypothetical protein